MKLPRLYAPVKITFWTLRNRIDPASGGMCFDCDEQVTRRCMRVRTRAGWKWQLIGLNELLEWDWEASQDQEVLDAYEEEMEFELAA